MLGVGTRLETCWFKEVTKKEIGKGDSVSFWSDVWIGREPLKAIFSSLYNHCEVKEATVAEMGRWQQHAWKWNWEWTEGLPQNVAQYTTGG